jgi:hypothetical protein
MDHINPDYLLIGALALAGTLLVCSGLEALVSGIRSRNWPRAAGKVTVSKVVKVIRRQDSPPNWAPEIHYRYVVNNITTTGTLVRFGMEGRSGGRKFATGYTDRYPLGKAVPVFYDPNRVERSVLETGTSLTSVWPLALGLALLWLSLAFGAHVLSPI